MPRNDDLSNRAKSLVAKVQAITQRRAAQSASPAKQYVEDYKALTTETYANLQKFLKSQGADSVDEWLARTQKELTLEEAAKVHKAINHLQPPQGLAALTQPSEIAKFMAGWYITQEAMPIFQTAAVTARSWLNNYFVINRLPVLAADGAEVASIASEAGLAEAATFVEGEEVATMLAATEAEVGSIVVAEGALAAETAAVAAAEVASVWNIFFVAAGAVVLAGTYAWQKHKESEDAEKLKSAIAEIATARLYALVSERRLLTQTDQKATGKDQVAAFFRDSALQIAQSAAAAVDVKGCYEQLRQQDETNHAMTEADPSYDDMVRRHDDQVNLVTAS
ncbi:hypothetical protein B0T24DRAFT_592819 [Lasiosphaeria ovina]|uniref:Uncharacterized protein n=1 Tax=Lasiosphaeria ovina TaxID=92902 RepID=A0AAE0KJL8_9PEZI|nr:hypothetical protein B0T24DRAFT_592819 [Lasiosphaeria ovina]